ncbi:MAG: PLP-dependent aminotransferase family protein [Tissierellia bacterium]|nr:PLP-dependent aminotransferase family protein [Tissierellia bacterium]
MIINKNNKVPLYEQLYNYLKSKILNSEFKTKDRLPSKRELAKNFGISVNTVTTALEQLVSEGYIESKERSGFYVLDINNLYTSNLKAKSNFKKDLSDENILNLDDSFYYNAIAYDLFPSNSFRKIFGDIINRDLKKMNLSPQAQGDYSFRKQICNYLEMARGFKTKPENIIISAGMEYLFQILFSIMDDQVFGIENPGYNALPKLLKNHNKRFYPINLDSDGLSVKNLEKTKVNMVITTPSHQFPTGIVMPINRRVSLLNWAYQNKSYIIEDDYDSEFRYIGKPIPSLKSLDEQDRVIFMGNFSKSISPTLRISFMVLPDKLVKIYHERLPFLICPVSGILQAMMTEFFMSNKFVRHINRMRRIYRKRRDKMIDILKNYKDIELSGTDAGLHLIAEFKNDISEEELISSAKAAGFSVYTMSEFFIDKIELKNPKLLLGFGSMHTEIMDKKIRKLFNAFGL